MTPSEPRFLDTNILLASLTRDDAEKAERALALLLRVEQGEEQVETSPPVVFEVVFTLQRVAGALSPPRRRSLAHLVGPRADGRGKQHPSRRSRGSTALQTAVGRRYRMPKESIRALIGPIVAMRHLHLEDKQIFARAFDLFIERNVAFADAFNVATMEARGITTIYSWDTDFDRFPSVVRLEPEKGRDGE